MLADPQSVTINAVAISLPAVRRGDFDSKYQAADANTALSVKHTIGSRARRVVRIDSRKIAADPFVSGKSNEYSMSAYIVFDVPLIGFTNAEAKLVIDGFLAYLTASSGAKITSVLGGES